jgi:hypothetical protein
MVQQLNDNFVIIAGASKSGSTSLFQYLSDHPHICEAVDKEIGFFFHPQIAQQQPYKTLWTGKFYTDELSTYLNAFVCQDNKSYKLEASTGYIYSPDSAQVIHQSLPNAKLIFIFRDPVERFISIFKFHQQRHHISPTMTIEQYIEMQTDSMFVNTTRILRTGNYAQLLRPYWELFNHDELLLLGFSQLKHDPKALMRRICTFLEIDASYYQNYTFDQHNPTQTYRNLALDRFQSNLIMPIRRQLQRYPQVFRTVSAINYRTWLPLYQRLNSKPVDKSDIPADAINFLRDYYKDEARLLYELTGVDGLLD